MNESKLRIWGAIAVVVAVTVTAAAGTATEAIKQRQHEMEGVKSGMMTLGAIAKKQTPFDAEVVQASAQTIADRLQKAAELFPDGSDTGDVETWAKAEIWSDPEDFQEQFETATEAAVALQSVTEEAAFLPALGALGNRCKGCHDAYRRPKQ